MGHLQNGKIILYKASKDIHRATDRSRRSLKSFSILLIRAHPYVMYAQSHIFTPSLYHLLHCVHSVIHLPFVHIQRSFCIHFTKFKLLKSAIRHWITSGHYLFLLHHLSIYRIYIVPLQRNYWEMIQTPACENLQLSVHSRPCNYSRVSTWITNTKISCLLA